MSEVVAKVTYTGALQFVGSANSGHAIVMDGPAEVGGTNTGPRPMELLLIGLGGCTGMDAISLLKKKRQDVTALEITVKGIKDESAQPNRFTEVEIMFTVKGKGVDEAAVKRSIELSMEKYCSVKATLEQNTKIGFSYEIIED